MQIEKHETPARSNILSSKVSEKKGLSLPRFSENRRMLAALGIRQVCPRLPDLSVDDVKAEIQRISVPAGSSGAFSQIAGGRFASDTDVTVFSLCLDFVF